MSDPGMMHDPDQLRPAVSADTAVADVAAQLRALVGLEAYGRLLEASKITGVPVLQVLRSAAAAYATLVGQEQTGWAIQLARGNDIRGFSLD